MEDKTWMNPEIDRSAWGQGEWQEEPDKAQWTDPATGLPCLAVRHPHGGHWCGYVGVPPTHPLHGKDYNEVYVLAPDVRPHGGLTFSDKCSGEELGVCHIVGPGEEENVWWLGFDCAHLGDLRPGDKAYERLFPRSPYDRSYRALSYVKQECAEMAATLAKVVA